MLSRGAYKAIALSLTLTWSLTGPLATGAAASPPVATAPGRGPASVWLVSRSPKLKVAVAAGCPTTVKGYHDVLNTFPGPPLVPQAPTAGMICRYSALGATLLRSTPLAQPGATRLAQAVDSLSLKPPRGAWHCPMDTGTVAVIGLSYQSRADVGLWYQTSGCQTLDNGRVGSFQGGNPSFYKGFVDTIDRLSPPTGR